MSISKVESIRIPKKLKPKETRRVPFKDAIRRRPTLKELQAKKYPFLDLDITRMPDDFI